MHWERGKSLCQETRTLYRKIHTIYITVEQKVKLFKQKINISGSSSFRVTPILEFFQEFYDRPSVEFNSRPSRLGGEPNDNSSQTWPNGYQQFLG